MTHIAVLPDMYISWMWDHSLDPNNNVSTMILDDDIDDWLKDYKYTFETSYSLSGDRECMSSDADDICKI